MAQVENKELNEEQKLYLSSFKEAMRAIDEAIKNGQKPTRAYKRLVSEGYWSPDRMGFEFALCTGNFCTLPKALREYIISVGMLAKQIYDKSLETRKNDESNN